MSAIINLTQHAPTQEQTQAGVVDIDEARRTKLVHFLTVPGDTLTAPSPLREELLDSRAHSVFCLLTPELAEGARRVAKQVLDATSDMAAWNATKEDFLTVMVGGAPYLTDRLVRLFRSHGCRCVYALSERVSKEETMPDGSVKKTQVFQHIGFVDA